MTVPGSANPLLLRSAAPAGYQIQRSLRFNSSDSAYLSRTPASAGNRKTWTWAGWVKRSGLGNFFCLMSAGGNDNFGFSSADKFQFYFDSGVYRLSTQVFRDVSAWYHLVVVYDSPNATAQNRIRVYVNGSEITAWDTNTTVSQNRDSTFNATNQHAIARNISATSQDFPGYLADIHFIDGQALTPTSFGEFDTNNVWQPKAYSGTYGTNGFHLDFADNSAATATTLGKDTSGNGNNCTPNNLSVTAGAGNDSLVDSPTNYGTDTGAGGEVRGNYATLNPLDNGGITLANGNLDSTYAGGSTWKAIRSTIGVSAGKYYWEFTSTSNVDSNNSPMVGLSKLGSPIPSYPGFTADSWGYNGNGGSKFNNGAGSAYGAGYTNGDVIGVAFDADNGTLTFYKNNVSQGTAFTGLTPGPYAPAVGFFGTSSGVMNFGQRPWAFTPPAGFKALCTTNLPEPTIADPSTVMDVVTYTGNGGTQTISGLGFSPDLVWIKERNNARDHVVQDIIRGSGVYLSTNLTNADQSNGGTGSSSLGVQFFNSDGFTIGAGTGVNSSSNSYVAWTWDAGSSTVTNTAGSISSQVRANPSAGFSIVTFTSPSSGSFTVGHGLGAPPSLIILKDRGQASSWSVYHSTVINNNEYLLLNSTAAKASSTNYWGTATPSSTVFGANAGISVQTSDPCVAYCFAPVAGYSSFGSYTGNGSTDGPFVYTGFRPRWVMIKCSSASGGTGVGVWIIKDALRSAERNPQDGNLYPHLSNAEDTASTGNVDLLSNGFKIRGTYPGINKSPETYIYAAFAESPFALARAR